MTIPSKPYTTSINVGLFMPNLLKGGSDFTSSTIPTKTAVDQFISWVSDQIDLQFQQAGYVVPFVELSGESWPSHQTQYLQLLATLGASAMTGGWSLKPAPAVARGRDGSSGNIFQELYEKELAKIWNPELNMTSIRFRTRAYSGTPAEKSITEPRAPSLDYIEGEMNPEDFLTLEPYTDLRYSIEQTVLDNSIYWPDYWTNFQGLFSGKDTGYAYSTLR